MLGDSGQPLLPQELPGIIGLPLHRFFDKGPAFFQVLRPVFTAEELLDLILGLCRLDDAQPIRPGAFAVGVGDDLNHIAVFQYMVQRHHLPIDLGAGTFDPDFRVDLEGKVQRRAARRQFHDFSLRGEDEYLIGEHIHLQGFHELLGVIHFFLQFDGLPQPGQFLFRFFVVALDPGLILPMGRDTVFRYLMHLPGPDLDLERRFIFPDQRGMDGLIHIGLGDRDIVLEPVVDRHPHGVDQTQDRITVSNGVHDDPDRRQVEDLV